MFHSKTNFLSIDYGTKKSGLAYSVEDFCFALKTIPTTELKTKIPEILRQKGINAIVIGMPYNIDGSLSRHAGRVQKFAKELKAQLQIPIYLYDERLSSARAQMDFADDGIDGDIDAEAARLILADFLDAKNDKNLDFSDFPL
jgi:putative holliday junction resolvase